MSCNIEGIVGLLLLLGQLQLTGSEKVFSDPCGHIKIENPDLLFYGRNVTIHFLPNQTFNQFNATPTIWNINAVVMDHLHTSDNETNVHKFVLINYPNNLLHDDFYIKYGSCITQTFRLHLKDCGHLYMRTPCVLVGSHAELVFIPAPAVVGFNSNYVLYWLETSSASNERRIYPATEKLYKQRNESDSTYVLMIRNIAKAIDGNTYRVQCTDKLLQFVFGNKYTDPITINVFQTPDAPVLSPLHDLDDCKGCLLLHSNNSSRKIYCKTLENRTNVSMKINGRVCTNIERTGEMYILIVDMVTDKDHLTNVSCSVINCAIKEPLVVSAQLYVAKIPGKLQLNVPVIYKGMAPNITCSIKGGRPKSSIYMFLNSDVITSTQIDIFDEKSRTYESTATVTSVPNNSWNENEIQCYQKQPYNLSAFVAESKSEVRYMYPPSEVSIQLDKYSFSKQRESYIIDVSCNFTETNMPCTMTWSPTPDDLVYLKRPGNMSDGSFITFTAQLNATRQMNGRNITCTMHCAPFESLSVSEVLYIPFTPMVLINSSQVTPRKDGSSYSITCYADSYPPPNITWRYTKDGTEHTQSCKEAIKCPVLVSGLLQGEKRDYVCSVEHMFGTFNASVIAKGEESAMVSKENRPSSTILVVSIVVSCLFLAGLVIGIVMCIKLKRRNQSSMPSRRNGDPPSNDLQDKNRESSVEYAVVSKSRNKQTLTQSTTEINPSHSNECTEGQLVYVELDTQLLEARSTSGSKARSRQDDTPRQEETIEYVDIDFAKKSKPQGDDNIYANQ
ncbi:uncharacterized protein LOC127863825 isoform X2 [Dreissena polymorpha]|uniref:uncharacterized protein LOC127863825 isoform X2 n=1 Tax=Dreissena polymorpha TaxID=45954 RepID=UPI002263BA7C|nr:uncharacterized protein LOC127863825 isoform X2 [Dreissena polymorpha]